MGAAITGSRPLQDQLVNDFDKYIDKFPVPVETGRCLNRIQK
jgi:hypothetical protein